jgi:hypothetical protein
MPGPWNMAFTGLTRLSMAKAKKGGEKLMFFVKRPCWCPLCHDRMANISYTKVPDNMVREFARMNKWGLLSIHGWYACPNCNIFIHKPTVDMASKA